MDEAGEPYVKTDFALSICGALGKGAHGAFFLGAAGGAALRSG